MTVDDAVSKAKRNSLIIEEFLGDTQIQEYVVDAADGATDYTDAMVNEATIAMLTAIAAVASKTYTRGAITITRESVLKTLAEFKNKVGVGVVNLYRGDPDDNTDEGIL